MGKIDDLEEGGKGMGIFSVGYPTPGAINKDGTALERTPQNSDPSVYARVPSVLY
jgi:hypothetical protein